MAGRVILAKVVLSSIPTHVMQCHNLHTKTTNSINKTIRDFIWGSSDKGRRIHLLHWNITTLPRKLGGLQIWYAKYQNTTLLSSLAWRFHSPANNQIWKSILNRKYLTFSSHNPSKPNPFIVPPLNPKSSFIWKNLTHGWKTMINYSRSIIGDETTIRFWLDPWINTIFKPLANYLSGALTKQDLTLNLKEVRSNGHWNFSKLSYPNPKDIQSRITEAYIPHNPQNTTHQDKLCWSITTNAVFTVSSCYHALIVARNSPLNYLGNISNLSWIWKTRV